MEGNEVLGLEVPGHYLGLWRCLSHRGRAGQESLGRAYWIQTHWLFARLRIPSRRPPFPPVARLEQLDDDLLLWLARQEGCAGRSNFSSGYMQRERLVSFQPLPAINDSRMCIEGGLIVEQDPQHTSRQEWQTIGDCATDDLVALELLEDSTPLANRPARAGFLLVVGDFFMYALDRRPALPSGASLAALVARASSHEAKAALLDCEISFGRRRSSGKPWRIQHSTLPYREGESLFEHEPRPVLRPEGVCLQNFEQGVRRWAVREWTPGVHWGYQT